MDLIYDVWFSRIEISNKIKLELLKKYGAKNIWLMKQKDLKNIFDDGKEEKIIDKILDLECRKQLEKYVAYLENKKISIIKFFEKDYPAKLLNIENYPAYIFVRGNKEILNDKSIAIVGSRNATEKGKCFTRNLAKKIADRNINIVSGLALGIDKYAHLGALDSNIGKTVAVLGTGLADSDIYPAQNRKVFERILEKNGTIVSEYIIGTKPLKYHFPMRNRIISGLSDKVIVVEAKEKSGSLITADFALEQGKDIYAVPGKIDDQNSKGTNRLIKEGAYLLEGIEDLFINY